MNSVFFLENEMIIIVLKFDYKIKSINNAILLLSLIAYFIILNVFRWNINYESSI